MTEPATNKTATVAAHIISDLFSPLLAPSYALILALWFTLLRYLPLGVKLMALGGVFFITAVIPALVIFVLYRMGRVSDMSISDKSQRTMPYSVSIACYIGAGLFLSSMQAPAWLDAFFYGAAVVSLLSLIITHWWKISAHTGGMGDLAAVCYWLAFHNVIALPMIWVSIAFALVGAMGWARLYLRHHTPLQVFAGATMAFLIEYIALTFL